MFLILLQFFSSPPAACHNKVHIYHPWCSFNVNRGSTDVFALFVKTHAHIPSTGDDGWKSIPDLQREVAATVLACFFLIIYSLMTFNSCLETGVFEFLAICGKNSFCWLVQNPKCGFGNKPCAWKELVSSSSLSLGWTMQELAQMNKCEYNTL